MKPLKQLYKTENEALQDVYRLIMFEDFEGLKKRAMTMQKERTQCDVHIKAQNEEITELRQ